MTGFRTKSGSISYDNIAGHLFALADDGQALSTILNSLAEALDDLDDSAISCAAQDVASLLGKNGKKLVRAMSDALEGEGGL